MPKGLFKQIEAGTKELTEKKDLDRTKAAVKLNDLAKRTPKSAASNSAERTRCKSNCRISRSFGKPARPRRSPRP